MIELRAQGAYRATATAQVILQTATSRAILIGSGLRAPSGGDHELWVIRGDQKIPAGLLRGDETGRLITALDPALLAGSPPDALAVPPEPSGGGPAPRGPIVMLGPI